jgi:replication-associated recombination protein RarA
MSTHKIEKNATLKPDVLELLSQQAKADGRSVDDLLDEAARKFLETKHTISEMRSFVKENRADMLKRGFAERDVLPAIKEYRKEKRER